MSKRFAAGDEPPRLTNLRALGLLDTAPHEHFDRITALVQRLFDVPIAMVTFVDEDRLWFRSHAGLSASQTTSEVLPGALPFSTTLRSEPTAASATLASAIETVLTSFGISMTSERPAATEIGSAFPAKAEAAGIAIPTKARSIRA